MKKGIFATLAVLMIGIAASAQTVTIYGTDDKVLSTYKQGEVQRVEFSPAGEVEDPATKEAVDLGLSVKWATCNLGAQSPEDYGDYYAWGETAPKASYTSTNSLWLGRTAEALRNAGIVDSDDNLQENFDAATANWGADWRMPTNDEIKELVAQCTWTLTTLNGRDVYQVTGPSGESIYLPMGGYYLNAEIQNLGSMGCYWSATVDSKEGNNYAYYFCITPSEYYREFNFRLCGQSVRPVLK